MTLDLTGELSSSDHHFLERLHCFEHALGFGAHVARKIEARKIEARGQALRVGRAGRGGDKVRLPIAEVRLAVKAPGLRIEHERTGAITSRSGASARVDTSKRTWSLPFPVQPCATASAPC